MIYNRSENQATHIFHLGLCFLLWGTKPSLARTVLLEILRRSVVIHLSALPLHSPLSNPNHQHARRRGPSLPCLGFQCRVLHSRQVNQGHSL